MTVRFDPKAPILGLELRQYRAVLLAWDRHRNLDRIPDTRRKGLDPWLNALVVDDAEARGLFSATEVNGYASYGATHAGKGLLKADSAPRIPAARGREILDGVLANAAAMNADRTMPVTVERIWLFGSLAKGAAEVSDIDIVLEHGRRFGDIARFDRMAIRRAVAMGGESRVARAEFKAWAARDHLLMRGLFGARRHPRIACHALWDLQNLGCPCTLVFDRAKGGAVTQPLLDRHPESEGPHPGNPPAFALPDLVSDGPVQPVALEHAAAVSARYMPSWLRDEPISAFGHSPLNGEALGETRVRAWIDALPSLDGRRRAVVVDGVNGSRRRPYETFLPCLAIEVERQAGPAGLTMRLMSAARLDGAEVDAAAIARQGFVLGSALGLDALRLRRQGLIGEAFPPVVIEPAEGEPWLAAVREAALARVEALRSGHDMVSMDAHVDVGLSGPCR